MLVLETIFHVPVLYLKCNDEFDIFGSFQLGLFVQNKLIHLIGISFF